MMKGTSKSQEAPRIMKAYTSVMRSFRSTYESADSTLQCIQKAVEYLKTTESVGKGLMHAPKSAHPLLRDAVFPRSSYGEDEQRQEASGNAWADLVVYEPQSYMRIAMVVEYSLAQCHPPDESDLARVLQASAADGLVASPVLEGAAGALAYSFEDLTNILSMG